MAINQEENLGPMKLIFNYNNVFYSFFYDDLSGCIHRSREYALNYVYSGEMILNNGTEKIHVRKGECVFIPVTTISRCIKRHTWESDIAAYSLCSRAAFSGRCMSGSASTDFRKRTGRQNSTRA